MKLNFNHSRGFDFNLIARLRIRLVERFCFIVKYVEGQLRVFFTNASVAQPYEIKTVRN